MRWVVFSFFLLFLVGFSLVVWAVPNGTHVATLELGAPPATQFTLHGTMPIPAGVFTPAMQASGSSPFSVIDFGGATVSAETIGVTRTSTGDYDVVEIIARVNRDPAVSVGTRIQYKVVTTSNNQPAWPGGAVTIAGNVANGPVALSPEIRNLLSNPIIIRSEDVFGNKYEADLTGKQYVGGQQYGSPKVFRYGNEMVEVRTYNMLRPVAGTTIGPPTGALTHFMGVHAYFRVVKGEPVLQLDLSISNSASGLAPDNDPLNAAMKDIYFKNLELVVPNTLTLDYLFGHPSIGTSYAEGSNTVYSIVRTETNGRMHLLTERSHISRRTAIGLFANSQKMRDLLEEQGIAFSINGQSTTSGFGELWSWHNPATSAWYPTKTILPTFNHIQNGNGCTGTGLPCVRSYYTGKYNAEKNLLESGAAGGDYWNGALDIFSPRIDPGGGMPSGSLINIVDGVEETMAASREAYLYRIIKESGIGDRSTQFIYRGDGEPLRYEDAITTAPNGPVVAARFFDDFDPTYSCPGSGMPNSKCDVFGYNQAQTYQSTYVGTSNLGPLSEATLRLYGDIDFQHWVRAFADGLDLAYANDSMGKDTVAMRGELAHFGMASLPMGYCTSTSGTCNNVGDPICNPSGNICGNGTNGRALQWGRGQWHPINLFSAAYSFSNDNAWRAQKKSVWFDRLINIFEPSQILCTGILAWRTGQHNGWPFNNMPANEAGMGSNSMEAMVQSVMKGADPTNAQRLQNILNKHNYSLLIDRHDSTNQFSWSFPFSAPYGTTIMEHVSGNPIYCKQSDVPPAYYTYNNKPGNYEPQFSFAYGKRATGDTEFDAAAFDIADVDGGTGNTLLQRLQTQTKYPGDISGLADRGVVLLACAERGLCVWPPPAGSIILNSAAPNLVTYNQSTGTIALDGGNFQSGDQVEFIGYSGVAVTVASTFVSAASLTASLTAAEIAALGVGVSRVHIKRGASTFSNTVLFTITSGATPTLTSISPNNTITNQNSPSLTLTGASFLSGDQAEFIGASGTVTVNTTFTSSNSLTASLTAAQTVTLGVGTGSVRVKRGASLFSNSVPFTVTSSSGLTLTSISPNSTQTNQNSSTLTLVGFNFASGDLAEFTGSSVSVVTKSTTFGSSTSLTTSLTAAETVALGVGAGTVLVKRGTSIFSNSVPFTITSTSGPTVTLSATDTIASEPGTDTGTYTITRTGSTSAQLAVKLSISGTAANGVDYNFLPQTKNIPSGSSSVTLTVRPIDDLNVEGDETVVMNLLSDSAYAVGSPSSGTVTIGDDDTGSSPLVTVQATDPNAAEAGLDPGAFTIIRTGATTSLLVVSFTISGTASNGVDYNSITLTKTIPVGSSSVAVVVTPIDDSLVEGSENVVLTLQNGSGYVVGSPSAGTVTIADNDTATPTVTIVATDPNAAEAGLDSGTFTITRTGAITSSLAVTFTVTGTASNGVDYNSISVTKIIPINSSTATVVVTPIDDSNVEGSETVVLTLSSSANYIVGSPSTGTVTIADNDTAPFVTVMATDSSAAEAGLDPGVFTISRTGPTTSSLVVSFTIAGTALNGVDYNSITLTKTIPAGASSATVVVNPFDDSLVEGNETVILSLQNGTGYLVGSPSAGTVTIADNDTATPTVTIVATDPNAAEAGLDSGTFTITRTGAITSSLAVTFTVTGTASNGVDYNSISVTKIIPINSSAATVVVTPIDDSNVEGSETVVLTLSSSANYIVGSPSTGTVTIADDDGTNTTVSILATDSEAAEAGLDPGRFTLTRSGPTVNALTANFTISGSASNGVDYNAIALTRIIPAGATTVNVVVLPIDDLNVEGSETVILTLQTGTGYTIGTPVTGTVTIADNDTASFCGNGIKEGSEECDGSDFGVYGDGVGMCSVYSSQYSGGDLLCSGCAIDTSSCTTTSSGTGGGGGSGGGGSGGGGGGGGGGSGKGPFCGNGICSPGEKLSCPQDCGSSSTCVSSLELCDGIDNDCDNQVDEGCPTPNPIVSTCFNGQLDSGELDVDCGGVCSQWCAETNPIPSSFYGFATIAASPLLLFVQLILYLFGGTTIV